MGLHRVSGQAPAQEDGPMQAASYRVIPIRNRDGGLRAEVVVDAEDFDALNTHHWHLAAGRYAARSQRFGAPRRKEPHA